MSGTQSSCESQCRQRLTGHYFDLFLNNIKDLLQKVRPGDYNFNRLCIKRLEEAMYKSTHLARAKSVAYLVGFCRYFGRLVESYGVSQYYTGITPGKGTLIHKVLALASIEFFEKYNILNYKDDNLKRVIDDAINIIISSNMYTWLSAIQQYKAHVSKGTFTDTQKKILFDKVKVLEERLEAIKQDATRMFRNLLELLRELNYIGYIKRIDDVQVLPEMQMADYALRVIGTPDLILEFDDGHALVVEWKTVRDPEKAGIDYVSHTQSWLYALMEARRLGYGSEESSNPLGELSKALDPKNPIVLPTVITPKRYYVKHPLGDRLHYRIRKYADPCCMTLMLVVGSYHLAALHLIGTFDDEPCKVPGSALKVPSQQKVRVYSYTPRLLGDKDIRAAAGLSKRLSGDPNNIDETPYPCGVCKSITHGLVPLACKLNFAKDPVGSKIDSIYYIARRSVLARHLKDLEALKVAYHANPEDLISCQGHFVLGRRWSWDRRRSSFNCEVALDESGSVYRYFAPVKARFYVNPSYSDLIELVAPAKTDRYEILEDINLNFGKLVKPVTLRVGKPAAVYLYKNVSRITGNKTFTRLTHSPAAWLRVNDVEVDADSNEITIYLGLPSSSLKLNYMIFLRHLRRAGCKEDGEQLICEHNTLRSKGYGLVAIESQVDLTHYDLEILNQLRLLQTLVHDKSMLTEILKESDIKDDKAKKELLALSKNSDYEKLLTKIITTLQSELLNEPEARGE